MNATDSNVTGDTVPALCRVRCLYVLALAATLFVYGVLDAGFRADGRGCFGQAGLMLSFAVLFGMVVWLERRSGRRLSAVRQVPEAPVSGLEKGALLDLIRDLVVAEAPVRKLMGGTLSVSSVTRERASGNFFECVPWNDHIYDVVVGDVNGDGLAAALVGLEAKSGLLQSVTRLMLQDGSDELPEVGRVIAEMRSLLAPKAAVRESFSILCYARFDFDAKKLHWVDCGQAPIIHWQAASRRAVVLKGANSPLRFTSDMAYQTFRTDFASGDLFMICSEGIVGARNSGGQRFGVDRLTSAVEALSGLPVHECGQALRSRVADFTMRGKPETDEQTVVSVRVNESKSTRCNRKWRVECPVQVSDLKQFRQRVDEVYADPEVSRSVAKEESEQMLLALHEVLVNIIDHSVPDRGETSSSVVLEACMFDDRMEWTFAHGLAFFSPTFIHTPNEDGSQSHGYGLYIIEQTADCVRYYRNERGESCVKLIKWFKPEPAAGATGEGGL